MVDIKGKAQTLARDLNIKLIMRLLSDKSYSRSELSKALGLSNSALTKIVGEMMGMSFIVQASSYNDGTLPRGRKEIGLKINEEYGMIFAFTLTGFEIKIRLCSFVGAILCKRTIVAENTITSGTLDSVVINMREMLSEYETDSFKLLGICIGAVGKVNTKTKTLVKSYKYKDCENIDFSEYFTSRFGVPTIISNIVSLQMYAEKNQSLNTLANSIMLHVDYGFGGAVWLGNKLYEGDNGFAGEFGMIPVRDADGKWSVYEDICSINSMLKKAGLKLDKESFEIFVSKLKEQDGREAKILEQSIDYTAVLIKGLVKTFDVSEIIITGGISVLREEYLDKLSYRIADNSLTIRYSTVRGGAGIIGAVKNAIDHVVDDAISKR